MNAPECQGCAQQGQRPDDENTAPFVPLTLVDVILVVCPCSTLGDFFFFSIDSEYMGLMDVAPGNA